MDYQETAEMIRNDMKLHHDFLSGGYRKALSMAIFALEKQIPKKPDMIQTDYNANIWHLYCPSCKDWIGTWNGMLKRMDMRNILNGNICPYCGRAIDCTGVSNGSLC